MPKNIKNKTSIQRNEYSQQIKNFESRKLDFDFRFKHESYEKVIDLVSDVIWSKIESDVKGYKNDDKIALLKVIIRNLIAGLYYGRVIAVDLNANSYTRKMKMRSKKVNNGTKVGYRVFRKILKALESQNYIEMLRGYWNRKVDDALKTRIFATDKFRRLVNRIELKTGIVINKNVKLKKKGDLIIVTLNKISKSKDDNEICVEVREPKGRKKSKTKIELSEKEKQFVYDINKRLDDYNKFARRHNVVVVKKSGVYKIIRRKKKAA